MRSRVEGGGDAMPCRHGWTAQIYRVTDPGGPPQCSIVDMPGNSLLQGIDAAGGGDEMFTGDGTVRAHVGRAPASLRFRSLDDITTDLDQEMEHLQLVTAAVTRTLGATYVNPSG